MKSKIFNKRYYLIVGILLIIIFGFIYTLKNLNLNQIFTIAQLIDSLHNVEVYYNGGVNNVSDRNMAGDYNLGLKYPVC